MTDTASIIALLRRQISELGALANDQSRADELKGKISQSLDQLAGGQSGRSPGQPRTVGEAAKCPRCSLRSLRAVRDEERPATAGEGREALYYCSSCGYQGWQDIR